MARKSIAVIGGGASGMMAAITAADMGAKVTLYERNDRVGKKILSTGNGKCNFSNRQLSGEAYFGGDRKLISHVLKEFDAEDAVSFFEKAGMMVKDKNGYLYPASEQAATVLDVLRMQLTIKGVRVCCQCKVSKIVPDKKTNSIVVKTDKTEEKYDSVVLSCGGSAAPKTGSDGAGCRLAKDMGHTIKPVVPALVQLRCREEYLKAVSGVRAEASVSLLVEGKVVASERGELQLTDYGVSGIVVFQLSRIAAYALQDKKRVSVYIDLLPDISEKDLKLFEDNRLKNLTQNRTVEEFFTGMLNKKLMLLFCKLAGLKTTELVKDADRQKVDKAFKLCKHFPLTLCGTNPLDNAQISAGGVSLTEVTEELESKLHKGVYFAGEMLDVDGKCGGYNLQWAWSSGYVAGKAAAGESI